jgi:hypothetical protein
MAEEGIRSLSAASDVSDEESDLDQGLCDKGDMQIPFLRIVYNFLRINQAVFFPDGPVPWPLVDSDECFTKWILGILRSIWPGKVFEAEDIKYLCMHTHELGEGAMAISNFLARHVSYTPSEFCMASLRCMFAPDGGCLNPFSFLGLVLTSKDNKTYVSTLVEDGDGVCSKFVSITEFRKLKPENLLSPPKVNAYNVIQSFVSIHFSPGPLSPVLKSKGCVWCKRGPKTPVEVGEKKKKRGLNRTEEDDSDYSDASGADDSGEDASKPARTVRERLESLEERDADGPGAGTGKKGKRRRGASKEGKKASTTGGDDCKGVQSRLAVSSGLNRKAKKFLQGLPPSYLIAGNRSLQDIIDLTAAGLDFLRGCPTVFRGFLDQHNLSDVRAERMKAAKKAEFLEKDMSVLGEMNSISSVAGALPSHCVEMILKLFGANKKKAMESGVEFDGYRFEVVARTDGFKFPKEFLNLKKSLKCQGRHHPGMLQDVLHVLEDPLLIWILMSRVRKPKEAFKIEPKTFVCRLLSALRGLHETWRVYLRFGKVYTENGTFFDPISRSFIPPDKDPIFIEHASPDLKKTFIKVMDQYTKSGMPLGWSRYMAFEAVKAHGDYRVYDIDRNNDGRIFQWNNRDLDKDPGPILEGCPAAIKEYARTRPRTLLEAIVIKADDNRNTRGTVIASVDLLGDEVVVPGAVAAAASPACETVVAAPALAPVDAAPPTKKRRAPKAKDAIVSLEQLMGE